MQRLYGVHFISPHTANKALKCLMDKHQHHNRYLYVWKMHKLEFQQFSTENGIFTFDTFTQH
ncbi:CLUMA_CG010271, isoform A [Clunio marinus]|uniref:CLUMA_CG010271, isoform A n=1 Tax=Clunio marinus TaxID=568069 RepID=A0A1J1IE05_9DIPT|nr:CLUMA_CG010271, isoform A [Clunio marinus]